MTPAARTMPASEFKAKCLAVLDEVERTGLPVVVTKRGRPVAQVVPLGGDEPRSLLGSVRYRDESDLLAPVDEDWDAER